MTDHTITGRNNGGDDRIALTCTCGWAKTCDGAVLTIVIAAARHTRTPARYLALQLLNDTVPELFEVVDMREVAELEEAP